LTDSTDALPTLADIDVSRNEAADWAEAGARTTSRRREVLSFSHYVEVAATRRES
jgi:hypothetical protein